MTSSHDYQVEMPGGGPMFLQSVDEVDRWQTLSDQYQDQYNLRKVNDLTNLGTLLVQQINLYRAQVEMSGRVMEADEEGLPTGEWHMKKLKPAEIKACQDQITNASKEIRAIEVAMGIDKKSREASGDETLRGWLSAMKRRAHEYGLHISARTKAYEEFAMELRWRLRLNVVGDPEDKHYEDCTDEGILKWTRERLSELEQKDQEFAKEQGALVQGSAM